MVEGIQRPVSVQPTPQQEAPKTERPPADTAEQAQRAAQEAQQQAQQQAQREQSREAVKQSLGEAQDAQAAVRSDLIQQLQKAKEKLQSQLNEFVQVVEMVVQESVEGYHTPNIDQGAGAFTQDHGAAFTPKEQQMVREFLRQLKALVGEQGLELVHAFNHLKTQQGGEFWKQFNQVLQKGMAAGAQNLTPEQLATKLKAAGQLGTGEGEAGREILRGELGQGPGAALAEVIRAETNPVVHTEAMLAALALLKQEGMEKAHRELVQYLRHRWKMSEREMQRFLHGYPVTYFQGPVRQEKFKDINTPWYPVLALVTVPIAKLLGMDWGLALFGGVLLTAVLFLVAYLNRSTD